MKFWLKILWNFIMCLYGAGLIFLVTLFFFNYGGEWLLKVAARFPLH